MQDLSAVDILKKHWGYPSFRPGQEEIIKAILQKRDVLAVLPTGGGKSICFQVPAIMQKGICVVITPLIALMKDQVENLSRRGIPATAIYSGMHRREIDITLDNCIYGNLKFLYVSPERIKSDLFKERLSRMQVCLIAVDEAHCISQWGHDFRPAYLEIGMIREIVPDTSIAALTATAIQPVREEIIEKLALKSPEVFVGTFFRPNLSYSIRKVEDMESKIMEILGKVEGASIVYARTRKETREISNMIKGQGIASAEYHAGLTPFERSSRQDKWIKGDCRVMVATNAFGMGIDKPNVRSIIHVGIVSNMESYYQEAGRAGRDGKKAYATILFHEKNISEVKEHFERSYPDISFIQHVYQCLANYYKLVVGSERPGGFDFILHDFAAQYKLDHLELFYALKKMAEEDLIQLNDAFSSPSSVFIPLSHNDLYKYQIANARFDPVLKALLRTYGGELFTQFTQISEYKLAKLAKQQESRVKADLFTLHKQGVVIYSPQKDKPQLIFLTPRLDAAKLPLDKKTISQRKKNDRSKLEFMLKYIGEHRICRAVMIQDYFGEKHTRDCGICDVCVAKKKETQSAGLSEDIKNKILQRVSEGPQDVEQLVKKVSGSDPREVLNMIRTLVDAGLILYDNDGKITK